MNRIARAVALCLSVMFIVACFLIPVSANSDGTNRDFWTYTNSEARQILLDFFESNNINIEPGSLAYSEYIFSATENKAASLKSSPHYDVLLRYMYNYVDEAWSFEFDSSGNLTESQNFLNKTFGEVRDTNNIRALIIQQNMALQNNAPRTSSSSYNASNAVTYARRWANGYNPAYEQYSYQGDCTNFVSQCAKAGGMPMNMPSTYPEGTMSTTTYWYAKLINTTYDRRNYDTSSWIGVPDFLTYWTRHAYVTQYTNKNSLISAAQPGDVVIGANLNDGSVITYSPKHAMIISAKQSNDVLYCGHSTARLDESFRNRVEYDCYYLIEF